MNQYNISLMISISFVSTAPSASSQVFNATVTSSQSATLSWEPPAPDGQNGKITGYVINVTVLETGEMFQLFSETTSLTVDSLQPYRTYTCVIAARTAAGLGPFSSPIVVTTPEDGKHCEKMYYITSYLHTLTLYTL